MNTKGKLIPKFLTRYVDLIENILFLGHLESFWQRLIQAADLCPGDRVIDRGCGSGKLTEMIANLIGENGEVFGLDASPNMIELCNKIESGKNLEFIEGLMEDLQFPDNYFDKVVSSLAIHHIPKETKQIAFSEFKRVLKNGGQLIILDHGKPHNWFAKILMFPMRWNILEYQRENFRGEIPGMIENIFNNVTEVDRFFGWIKIWKAMK